RCSALLFQTLYSLPHQNPVALFRQQASSIILCIVGSMRLPAIRQVLAIPGRERIVAIVLLPLSIHSLRSNAFHVDLESRLTDSFSLACFASRQPSRIRNLSAAIPNFASLAPTAFGFVRVSSANRDMPPLCVDRLSP